MWIKCFIFCLIFNQVLGFDHPFISQDSTSNQKFKSEFKSIQLIKNEKRITKRIERLSLMQNLFKYWHVAHLPFALIMLIIMVIHVVVVLYFAEILQLWIK